MLSDLGALLILFLAIAIDLTLGEPPRFIHPVVWMGKIISILVTGGNNQRPSVQFVRGIGTTLVTIGLFTAPTYFMLLHLKSFSFQFMLNFMADC